MRSEKIPSLKTFLTYFINITFDAWIWTELANPITKIILYGKRTRRAFSKVARILIHKWSTFTISDTKICIQLNASGLERDSSKVIIKKKSCMQKKHTGCHNQLISINAGKAIISTALTNIAAMIATETRTIELIILWWTFTGQSYRI